LPKPLVLAKVGTHMNTETLTAMTGTASLVKCDIISRPPDIFVSPRWIFILVFLICLTLCGDQQREWLPEHLLAQRSHAER
jgi:hypothetical protein